MTLSGVFLLLSILFVDGGSDRAWASVPDLSHWSRCQEMLSKLSEVQKTGRFFKKKVDPKIGQESLADFCKKSKVLTGCLSEKGDPILHFDFAAKVGAQKKRILVFSLVHGDEEPSGRLAVSWMSRLNQIESRNDWRIVPVLNPDGWQARTRMNARGVDINRNYPTQDWDKTALQRWREHFKSDPRRYPGPQAGSEKETLCSMSHINDFNPEFVVGIHTPYGVLDFDGPKEMRFPKFAPLRWISLGNYPGSLGRYMWEDRGTPVLTIELTGKEVLADLEKFDKLQDISGTVAIEAKKIIEQKDQKDVQKN